MTTQFRRTDEVKGINDFGQEYSAQIFNATLAANTNTTLTVPGGGIMGGMTSATGLNKMYACIRVSYGTQVWVSVGAAAAVPAGASFIAATSESVSSDNPITKLVTEGDILNFKSAGTPSVSVTFYALPS